jgi:hypothetical protein
MLVICLVLVLAVRIIQSQQDHLSSNPSIVHYLGQTYTIQEWHSIHRVFQCWGKDGRWIDSAINTSYTDYRLPITRVYSNVNACDKSSPQMAHISNIWHTGPNECLKHHELDTPKHKFLQWNKEQMCKLINGRNILFIGDSLNQLFYLTLVSALADDDLVCPQSTCNFRDTVKIRCYDQPFTITVIRNDGVQVVKRSMNDPEAESREFLHLIDSLNISLAIMNRGAHWTPDEQVVEDLNITFRHFVEHYPQVSIIYRNTVPGHKDCQNPPDLLTEPQPEDDLPFHWGTFRHQNELIRDMIIKEYPTILYMDVYTPTILRKDAHLNHADCLHYCLPGPIDTWVMYLYNFLRVLHRGELV